MSYYIEEVITSTNKVLISTSLGSLSTVETIINNAKQMEPQYQYSYTYTVSGSSWYNIYKHLHNVEVSFYKCKFNSKKEAKNYILRLIRNEDFHKPETRVNRLYKIKAL